MTATETLKRYYEAFAKKDSESLALLYADNAEFQDPVFGKLTAVETKAMWTMLLGRAQGFNCSYHMGEAGETVISGVMIVEYQFGKKKRQVINQIRSTFEIVDGLIVIQKDHFNFWRWATMSMGTIGFAVGWMPFFRNKVKREAIKSLHDFMNKNIS